MLGAPRLDGVGVLVGLARIADLLREEARVRDLEVLADPRVGDHLGDLVRRGDRDARAVLLDVDREDVGDRAAVGREVVIAEVAGLGARVGEDQLPGELRLLVARAPDERDGPRPPLADVTRVDVERGKPALDLRVLQDGALVDHEDVHPWHPVSLHRRMARREAAVATLEGLQAFTRRELFARGAGLVLAGAAARRGLAATRRQRPAEASSSSSRGRT